MNIEAFREEYQQQKLLEEIVAKRQLSRPKTRKWQVAALFVILPFLICVAVMTPILLEIKTGYKILLFCLSIAIVLEGYLRLCLIEVVKCY